MKRNKLTLSPSYFRIFVARGSPPDWTIPSELTSQHFITPSLPPLTSTFPSAMNATLQMMPLCPVHLLTSWPVRTFHILRYPSESPTATNCPPGLNLTVQKLQASSVKILSEPSRMFHRCTLRPKEHETTNRPLGEKSTDWTRRPRSLNLLRIRFFGISHTWKNREIRLHKRLGGSRKSKRTVTRPALSPTAR